jgi:predicted nucleic-acid-binding Zn-ribbon protein
LFKILFNARLKENAALLGKELRECQKFDWVLGDWYLAVRCRACGTEFPFSREDHVSQGFYFTDSNQIVLTCMECKYALPYTAEQIIRVRAQ